MPAEQRMIVVGAGAADTALDTAQTAMAAAGPYGMIASTVLGYLRKFAGLFKMGFHSPLDYFYRWVSENFEPKTRLPASGNVSRRLDNLTALLVNGIIPIYCGASGGASNEIAQAFEERGWTGQKFRDVYYTDRLKIHKVVHYGVIFRSSEAPQAIRDRAIAWAKEHGDTASMKRTVKFLTAAHALFTPDWRNKLDFDELMATALVVVPEINAAIKGEGDGTIDMEATIPADRDVINAALEGFVQAAQIQLKEIGNPDLYASGVRYVAERMTEHWQLPEETKELGEGDCEDLVIWLAAQRRNAGRKCRADVRPSRSGSGVWHTVVLYPDGRIEDPSKRLGMERENMSGRDVTVNEASLEWRVEPLPDGGWRGTIRVPLFKLQIAGDGCGASVLIEGRGKTPATAIGAALKIARSMTKHPTVGSLVSPRSRWAVKAMGALARVARLRKPVLGGIIGKLKSEALRGFAGYLSR